MFTTIQSRVITIFIGFVLLLGSVFGASYVVLQRQADDGLLVNLAGRQRMLTQKMTKESMLLVNAAAIMDSAQVEAQKDGLEKTMRVFEMTLFALKEGGAAPLNLEMTKMRQSPAPTSPELKNQLTVVADKWTEFKKHLTAIIRSKGTNREAINAVANTNVDLLKEMNSAVGMMQAESESKVQTLYAVQSLALLLGLVLVGVGAWMARATITQPIVKLTEAARAMSTGNLNVEFRPYGSREVQELSASFDRMRASMVAAFDGGMGGGATDDDF